MKFLLLIVLAVIALFVIPVFLIIFSNSVGVIPDVDSWHGFIGGRYYGQYQVEIEYAIYALSLIALIVAIFLMFRRGYDHLKYVYTLPLILSLFTLGFLSPYMNFPGVSQCTSQHPNYGAVLGFCSNVENKDTEYAEWFCNIYCDGDPLAGLDNSKSVRMLALLAEAGHVHSQSVLGKFYLKGYRGVKKDLHKAEYWLTKAALQDDRDAQNMLGGFYTLGSPAGKIEDPDKALEWFGAAAANGHPAAMGSLFRKLSVENTNEQKRKMASYWLDKLESIGEPRAKIWKEEKKLE